MKTIRLAFLLLLLCSSAAAQYLASAERYTDSIFKPYRNTSSPGIAVSLIENGQLVMRKNAGMANIEHQAAFTHQTPVRLGYSGGREFMCAGLALMEAQGLLRFDDKVRSYFPQLPAWSAGVTIQDLLNHSSGFDDEWATMLLMQAHMYNRVDKEQLLRLLYNQPLPQVEPGRGYMYSNSDFALLRWIMEMAAQKPLPVYLQQELFEPLGMHGTFMNDQLDQLIPGLADQYYGEGRYLKSVGVKTSPGGNYRIVTTAADLEKWALALEDSNSLAAKAFRRLYRDARPIPTLSPEKHYVFGHEWQQAGNTTLIRHGGVNHDFYMTRIPAKKITIIALGSSRENMSRAMGLAGVLLNDTPPATKPAPAIAAGPIRVSREQLASYAGRYFEQNKAGHSSHIPAIKFYDLRLQGDSLHFYYTSTESFAMAPAGEHLFKDPDFGTLFSIGKPHPDSPMHMQAWPSDGTEVMNFVRSDATTTTAAHISSYTGQYYSRHLDFYCSIVLNEDQQLIIRRPTIADKPLIPYGNDRFLFEMDAGVDSWYVVAEFTRNAAGEVDGINMQHTRMMRHRWEKVK